MPKIDKEFKDKWPPLEPARFNGLKEDIRAAGRLVQPIVLDENDTILDGHHRFAICEELGIEPIYTDAPEWTKQSREAKILYILTNQVNRRRPTEDEENARYVEVYELVKCVDRSESVRKGHETRKNDRGRFDHDHSSNKSGKARHEAAEMLGVSDSKVKRAVEKNDARKLVEEVDPEAAATFHPTETHARAIRRAAKGKEGKERTKAIERAFKSPPKKETKGLSKEEREDLNKKLDELQSYRPSKEETDAKRKVDAWHQLELGLSRISFVDAHEPEEMAAWVKSNEADRLNLYSAALDWMTRFIAAVNVEHGEEHDNPSHVH